MDTQVQDELKRRNLYTRQSLWWATNILKRNHLSGPKGFLLSHAFCVAELEGTGAVAAKLACFRCASGPVKASVGLAFLGPATIDTPFG